MARILLISNDVIGPKMAGPGIRYTALARELGRDHAVALAAPDPSTSPDDELRVITYQTNRPKTLLPYLNKADVVIAQSLHPSLLKRVRQRDIRYIADLYDPIVLENLEAQREVPLANQQVQHDFQMATMTAQLAAADHILCASDRQRDYWLGCLTSLGRLTPEVYRTDPSLDSLISLLPFGYENAAPVLTDPKAVAEVIPRFNVKKDKLILWGGGIWNWFDPLSLIKAVEVLSRKRNDIKLLFLGTKHPNPQMPEMKMLTAAHELAEELKLLDTHVFFREGWLPYDQLPNFLLPTAVGVSTHFRHAETRFSFRTRILSYIGARRPILATKGDSMSDLIEQTGIGLTVDYEDVPGIVRALTTLVDDKTFLKQVERSYDDLWPLFTWSNLIKPLSERITADDFVNQKMSWLDVSKLKWRYLISGGKKVWRQKGGKAVARKLLGR
jgi:glycosyltransferase involved in cell wall biosynthesis